MLIPRIGTKERILFDCLIDHPEGVTYLDLVGTGINEENIDQIVNNLRTGMFDAENDSELRSDD